VLVRLVPRFRVSLNSQYSDSESQVPNRNLTICESMKDYEAVIEPVSVEPT